MRENVENSDSLELTWNFPLSILSLSYTRRLRLSYIEFMLWKMYATNVFVVSREFSIENFHRLTEILQEIEHSHRFGCVWMENHTKLYIKSPHVFPHLHQASTIRTFRELNSQSLRLASNTVAIVVVRTPAQAMMENVEKHLRDIFDAVKNLNPLYIYIIHSQSAASHYVC